MEISTVEELHNRNSGGNFPVMIEIKHDLIVWSKKLLETGLYENGFLRVINDTRGVVYKDLYYFPCSFDYTPPSDDGKIEASTSISITTIDSYLLQIIQNINEGATAKITTVFEKISLDEVVFTPIKSMTFVMNGVEYDTMTAKWKLSRDSVLSLNIPRILGTIQRFPSAS